MRTPKIYTLIFIKRNYQVLLGYKARGFGMGLWNGFGGKVEKNETILQAAHRELKEECNLDAVLDHIGVVTYFEEQRPTEDIVHVFTSYKFNGEIKESEEMKPIKWFDSDKMPFDNMWPDAPRWMQLMLENRYFTVNVVYGTDLKVVKSVDKKVFTMRQDFANMF